MKTKTLVAIAVVIVAGLALALFLRQGPSEDNGIKVGISLPLSGDAKVYGDEMLNGIQLALKMTEVDNESPRIVLVVEDDAGKSATSLSAFSKLIDVDGVQVVIGGAMSSTAAPLVPVAKERKVLLVSPAASAPDLCSQGGYFFRVWPSDVFEATALAAYAVERLTARTAAILYVNNDYGKGASAAFSLEFLKRGGEVILDEGYTQDEVEFRTFLTKIGSLEPDVLYVPGYYKELANILRQAFELGAETQFLGGVGFQEPKIVELAGQAAEGVIFTTPFYDAESSNPVTAAFAEAYESDYGEKPGIFAAHSFDATRAVADAFARGARTGEEIRERLLEMRGFPGAAGSLTFTTVGDVVKPVAFHVVREGEFVPLAAE